jgi:hypothetical protein
LQVKVGPEPGGAAHAHRPPGGGTGKRLGCGRSPPARPIFFFFRSSRVGYWGADAGGSVVRLGGIGKLCSGVGCPAAAPPVGGWIGRTLKDAVRPHPVGTESRRAREPVPKPGTAEGHWYSGSRGERRDPRTAQRPSAAEAFPPTWRARR